MCGIIGAFSPVPASLAEDVYLGLYALQHRGQEAAGIAWTHDSKVICLKGQGLVHNALNQAEMSSVVCKSAIGHVRYATAGGSEACNIQPLTAQTVERGSFAVVHNGNLPYALAQRAELEAKGALFQSSSDTELVLHLIAHQPTRSFTDALLNALSCINGAYSFIFLHEDKLIAARDPWGFRPLVLGQRGNITYVASESCAFDLLGATLVRDVKPGEVLVIDESGCQSLTIPRRAAKKYHCAFEYVYFARPDSVIDGISVYEARKNMGRALSKSCHSCLSNCQKHGTPDSVFVTGLPDSGTIAALGFSEQAHIPYESAIIRNRYSGRTFIEPTQRVRELGVLKKLNPMKQMIENKDIFVIDDSIVRGTTSIKVAELLKEHCNARGVHMCISSPPVAYPCYYGIDTPRKENLIAARLSGESLRRHLGVDSLVYLSIPELVAAIGLPQDQLCTACFDGNYMEEEIK